jgi:DNA-binding SARP family transcriptional activator
MIAARPPVLEMRLLGDFALRIGDTPLPPIGSARAQSLLVYLLLHRDAPQPRDRLAFILWPDSTEPQARTNLRHVLHDLRRALPSPEQFLEITSRTLQWRADAPCSVDIADYERALARARRDDAEGLAALREAVDAYTGDLLEALYDEWLLPERERLRQRQTEALERLIALLEARGEHTEALARAEILLRLDPLRESTHRTIVRLHASRGDQSRAVRAYHVCVETLQRELGASPSAATRALYERLLTSDDARAAPRDMPGAPLVGRVREWAQLTECWVAAERDGARLVMLAGEPGIGKTRLAEELRAWCERRGVAIGWARSYSAEGALPYAPVAEWLRADGVQPRVRAIDAARRAELARVVPELAPNPEAAPSDTAPDAEGRQRLFDAISVALLGAGRPLLLVLDDAQWCDPETLQLVHYVLRTSPRAQLLVTLTARREDLDEGHPATKLLTALRALDRASEIELGRLGRDDTATLSERLTHSTLTAADVDRLFAGTEGNPLFVIEALRAGWTNGRLEHRLAPKVQAVIEGRLGQLTPQARDVAGVAAVIGREFTAELLARSCALDEDMVVRALDELWRRRVVRELGADAYDFSHDRIREVAYAALGPARRRSTHRRVADVLERLHESNPEAVSAQVASHLDQASDAVPAVRWYERAAEVALARYANADAVRLLGRALELVRTRAANADRDAEELSLLTRFVTPLAAIDGYSTPRVRETQRRAVELGRALGAAPEAPLLRSLAFASTVAGDFAAARAHAEELRTLALTRGDDGALVESDYMLGIGAFWQGELVPARVHFEKAVARYRDEQRSMHLVRYALDPKVVCLSRLGNTLGFLGLEDDAVRASEAAVQLAVQVDHPQSYSTALVFACLLSLELRQYERLRTHVTAIEAERAKDGAPQVRSAAESFAGFVDALAGRTRGMGRVRSAVDEMLGAPAAPGAGALAARVLLETCRVTRDAAGGLRAVEQMRQAPSGSALWAAETERLRAEFLAARRAPAADVRKALDLALALARAQGAELFERRTLDSIRRLGLEG